MSQTYAPQRQASSNPPNNEEERQGGSEPNEKLTLTDQEFLTICKNERTNAVGMYYGDEIMTERTMAMRYYKGDMTMAPGLGGIPALPNRSAAVSTDVSDAILTALPDLVDIFIGGEEVGSFQPVGADDEAAAQQETDVVNHVILQQNDGFGLIHDGIHDALLNKVGVYMAWVEQYSSEEEEVLERQTAAAVASMQEEDVVEVTPSERDDQSGEQLYRVEVKRSKKDIKLCVESVAAEDFAVARDTKGSLRNATYCVMRTLPRAQDLIALGFDKELVDMLNTYTPSGQQEIDRARDTAGEHDRIASISDATHNMRQVVVHVHVVRVDADGDGIPEIWRIDSDDKEGVLLQKKRLNQVCFAAMTPFRQPHRFYGRSLADLLMEVQRIKTALTRAALDGRYFALNRRYEVNMAQTNENTISDLLNNTPGYPVRSKGDAVKPLYDKGFDAADFEGLEYFSTVAEQRTGIVRNAQGLNPDTLHDTKGGAEMLMAAAQKRLRMIARTLAETGFRDLFVLVHALLRQYAIKPMAVPIGKQWVNVNPSQWAEREHFNIEIGMGGGREHDVMLLNNIGARMTEIVQGQATGAISPPVVTPVNIYNFASDLAERSGKKNADRYFTDPTPAMQQAQQNPQPQAEDPAVTKAKMDFALGQQKLQQQAQSQTAKQQLDQWAAQQKAQTDQFRAKFEAQLAQKEAATQAQLETMRLHLEAATTAHATESRSYTQVSIAKKRPGGALNK